MNHCDLAVCIELGIFAVISIALILTIMRLK
jgi:hypothetical protein